MKQKGFTLIELLGVIIVLAIISVIAVPRVVNVVDSSKKKAALISAQNYVEIVEKIKLENIYFDLEGTYSVDALESEMSYGGESPSEGSVTINNVGDVSTASICVNGYAVSYINGNYNINGDDCTNLGATPLSCFEYEEDQGETDLLSFDIDQTLCEEMYTSEFGDLEDIGDFCNGGSDVNGASLSMYLWNPLLEVDYEGLIYNLVYGEPHGDLISYDINQTNCENFFSIAFEEDMGNLCIGGDDLEGFDMDFYLENIPEPYITSFKLSGVIENFVYEEIEEGITITNYLCGGYYDSSEEEKGSLTNLTDILTIFPVDFMFLGPTYVEYEMTPGTDMNPIIPSVIDGKEVIAIGDYAFSPYVSYLTEEGIKFNNNNLINSVVIPDTVTTIGEGAFGGNFLNSVYLSSNVVNIKTAAFSKNNISSIILPDTLETISMEAFGSNNISELIIPSSVTTIDVGAFYNNNLVEIIVPETVTQLGAVAFADNQIENYELNNTMTTIPASLFAANNIDTLVIPSTVESIEYAAFADNNITNIVIPEGVTSIGIDAFDTNPVASVTLPSTLTYLSGFANTGLTEITIPNGVSEIGESAFEDNSLTSVSLPDTLTKIGMYAFDGNNITSIVIPEGVTSIGNWSFQNNELTSLTLPSTLTELGNSAFYNNNLTSIVIPEGITSIENYTFAYNNLTSVSIPNSVTEIGDLSFTQNNILQGNATIDNTEGNVTLDSSFTYNGADGNTAITPVYLR